MPRPKKVKVEETPVSPAELAVVNTLVTPTPESDAPRELALDLGNIKSAMVFNNEVVTWPSITAPLSTANRVGKLPARDTLLTHTPEGEQLMLFGESARSVSPDTIYQMNNEDRYLSWWYIAMFRYALHRAYSEYAGTGIIYPRIITSVPAIVFKNKSHVQKIKDNLTGMHEITSSDGTIQRTIVVHVRPESVLFVPEGVGAWWKQIYSQCAGDYKNGVWVIEDYGSGTFDLTVMDNGHYSAMKAQSDAHCGMGLVVEAIQAKVYEDTGLHLRSDEIDDLLKGDADTFKANGLESDIREVRDTALIEIAARADRKRREWYKGMIINGILQTGGGTYWIPKHLKFKPAKEYPVGEPVTEGVRGTYEHLMATKI